MSDFQDWASRHTGRAGHKAAPPAPARAPGTVPSELAPPPPGWAYVPNAQYGFVLVPLTAPATAPMAHGQRVQPPHGGHPLSGPPAPEVRAPAFASCELVKSSGVDPYAELMAGVPDLVPPTGYDAMDGRPSPVTSAALANDALFSHAINNEPPRSFASHAHQPAKRSAPLPGGS